MTYSWVKSTVILRVFICFGKKISLPLQNKIIYNFMILLATKNGRTKENFSPSSFSAVVGSGTDRNQDPGYSGSGINIPDPQH
jgi:hypothetical protein